MASIAICHLNLGDKASTIALPTLFVTIVTLHVTEGNATTLSLWKHQVYQVTVLNNLMFDVIQTVEQQCLCPSSTSDTLNLWHPVPLALCHVKNVLMMNLLESGFFKLSCSCQENYWMDHGLRGSCHLSPSERECYRKPRLLCVLVQIPTSGKLRKTRHDST